MYLVHGLMFVKVIISSQIYSLVQSISSLNQPRRFNWKVLPPPQARNTLSIFLPNNNNRIRQSGIFQALRACQISFRKMYIFS